MAQFAAFTHDLLQARFRTMGTARNTRPLLRADRVALKILNAPWMLTWFQQNTDAHLIPVLRHPGGQARSVMRLGWQYPVEAYLERPAAMERLFTPTQMTAARKIMAGADPWACAVLDWVVTSHPLRHAQGLKLHLYENIVSDPAAFVSETLVARCGLRDVAAMNRAITQPSGSSHLSTEGANASIAARDVDKIVNGWRAKTSAAEHAVGQDILDTFGVTLYRFDA